MRKRITPGHRDAVERVAKERNRGRDRGARDAGKAARAFEQHSPRAIIVDVLVDPRAAQIGADDQQLLRIVAQVECARRTEAAHEKSGADEQHDRQRDLSDDEERADPGA